MRKIKSERNVKKIKNSIDNFYMYYIKCPGFADYFKNLSNKEINQMSSRIKIVVDNLYLRMKVEEKYMYWSNLYEMYDLLCAYFNREDKFLKSLGEKMNDKKVSEKIEKKNEIDIIENKFRYETAFNDEIYHKADDCLHWLFVCLNKYIDYYHGRLKNNNPNELVELVDKTIMKQDLPYKRIEKNISREINYINNILGRVQYAREHIDVVYSLLYKDYDKKYIKMLKGTLTRIGKLISLIIDDIEGAYAA